MQGLLDFGFFIDNVLANDRVEFLDFHLVGHISLVLAGRVVMSRPSRRNQFDFFSHDLDLLSTCPDFADHLVDSHLVDDPHTLG